MSGLYRIAFDAAMLLVWAWAFYYFGRHWSLGLVSAVWLVLLVADSVVLARGRN